MAKMHELLAVESSITSNYNRDREETLKVLGRADLFTKTVTKKEYFNEDEAARLNQVVTTDMTTTVEDRLSWFAKSVSKLFDLVLQKDMTNQKAIADIEVDGTVLATSVPATTLLMLESKLQDLRGILKATPTLPAGVMWGWDENTQRFYSKEPVVSFTTKKMTKPVTLYEATKEHPAQVKEVSEDVAVAKITKDTFSGMLTSARKADLLGRLDSLLQGVKKARQRANTTQVEKGAIGASLMTYLFK